MRTINRKQLIIVAVCLVILAIMVGGRGCSLARSINGRYLFSSFLFDLLGFCLIIVLICLLSYGVKYALKKAGRPKTNFLRILVHTLHVLIVLIIAGPFLFAILQFHPQRITCQRTPRDVGLNDYTEVTFDSHGLTLSGWFIPAPQKEKPVVLITHGVGVNKDNFLKPVSIIHQLGYNAFIFDFRAHGASDGCLTTFGMKEAEDIKAAYDWITKNYPARPVYALAYSMGGSAVIKAAAEYNIFDKIVLDSTFSRMENVARASVLKTFGPLAGPLWHSSRFWGWLLTGCDMADNQPGRYMPRLANRPVLIIHGTDDNVISHQESLHLYKAINHQAELWLVENTQHVQSMHLSEYKTRLRIFFGDSNKVK